MSYIATTPTQRREMLDVCGVGSIEELFRDIPEDLRPASFDLPRARSEFEIATFLKRLAGQNYSHLVSFLGGGFYDHYIPAALEALVSRSEFYTAYTPYQPELSQGTLQAIYEYQSHICRLLEMDVVNASLYDGGTALYEACQMAISAVRRPKIVIDGGVNPIYRKMLYSYTANLSIEFSELPARHGASDREAVREAVDERTAAVILQNPNFFGVIDNHADIVEQCHERGALVIESVYPTAMALLVPPGEIGADIAVGEGQPLGIPLSFGGPYLGFIAARKKLARKMPGRIAGRTVDNRGNDGFVLTLQAREQHIRREKATSNICTNEALCALRAHAYLSLLGTEGLKDVARLCVAKTRYAKARLGDIRGVEVLDEGPVFNEFALRLPMDAGELAGKMIDAGYAPGFPLGRYYPGMENCLLVAVTEKRSKCEIGMFAEALEEALWS